MSVNFQDFADFAARACSGTAPIDWRMATARAYYASYHRAQLSMHLCPDNAHLAMGSHERVTERLKLHGSTPAKSIAYVLLAMKKMRNHADYEINDLFDQAIPVNQLATHHELVKKLDAFDQMAAAKSA